jgi:Leucine-rich repeat (LRR) protein
MCLLAAKLFLVLLALPCPRCIAKSTVIPLDRQAQALLHWKSNLNYQSDCLDSWSRHTSPCEWHGVTCKSVVLPHGHGRNDTLPSVVNISLASCGLAGRLDDDGLQLAEFPELRYLDLSYNLFFGSIPASMGNLTKLRSLDLSVNFGLCGYIPSTLGMLSRLENLGLQENNFSGPIPSSLGNLTILSYMDLGYNSLSGHIPYELGTLHGLIGMSLSNYPINGIIPASIRNLTRLQTLHLSNNQIAGSISENIGNLTGLQFLDLSNNQIAGSISENIGNLTGLQFLDLSNNQIAGSISENIGNLTRLQFLDLSNNQISRSIFENIGNLTRLQFLYLSNNQIAGSISEIIGNLTGLQLLDLSNNQIAGSIPENIGNLTGLVSLDLSNNQISGSISENIGNLIGLQSLDLSSNMIAGSIPSTFWKLTSLTYLQLRSNRISGILSPEIKSLVNLMLLDLSRNNLRGIIPVNLVILPELQVGNLSYNNFCGRFESRSFKEVNFYLDHNTDLCGYGYYGLPSCEVETPENNSTDPYGCPSYGEIVGKEKKRKLIWLLILALTLLFPICLAVGSLRSTCSRKKLPKTSREGNPGDMVSVWNFDGNITFQDILHATECFDEKYCIGIGGYGSVFRVELGGSVFAVKLLHSSVEGYIDAKTFHAEIEVLTKIRHRCIVKLYGYCSHSRCRFLVYQLIERGSLASILHAEQFAQELGWHKRVDIGRDVAQALSYLHHDYDEPIIHRDIKSSNILLDRDFKAYVSDFGMAKRLKHTCSSWSTIFAGTCGYMAPGKRL